MTDLDTDHPIKLDKARDQAAEYLGFLAGQVYDLGDGETWELPHPNFMPPDMKMRYLEHVMLMAEGIDFTEEVNPITGASTKRYLYPPRIDGKLVNEEERLCIALMGSDKLYQKFLAAGGRPGQLSTTWTMMQRQYQERVKRDSKSS